MKGMPESRHAVTLALLGTGIAAMLFTSLWQRFLHPSLTVSHIPAHSAGMERTPAMSAIGSLMEAVGRNPNDRKALTALAESLMASGKWEAAENFAQMLLAMDVPGEEDPRGLFLMAVINHNQGRHAQAAELFEKLLGREEDAAARYSVAIIYLHYLDKYDEGIAHLQKGLKTPGISKALADAMQEELARAQKRAHATPGNSPDDGLKAIESEKQ